MHRPHVASSKNIITVGCFELARSENEEAGPAATHGQTDFKIPYETTEDSTCHPCNPEMCRTTQALPKCPCEAH